MFNTMTLTKATAGLCGALLIFLFGTWAAETIYSTEAGGHGDEHAQAYVIEVESEDDAEMEEVVEEGPSFADTYATADASAGEGLWRNCRACHSNEEGKNGTGPSLYGVVDRAAGAMDGFNYSGAFDGLVDTWSPEQLDAFLTDPKGYAPGTTMGYRGLPKIGDRANLIAYLDSLDG